MTIAAGMNARAKWQLLLGSTQVFLRMRTNDARLNIPMDGYNSQLGAYLSNGPRETGPPSVEVTPDTSVGQLGTTMQTNQLHKPLTLSAQDNGKAQRVRAIMRSNA